MKIYPEVSIFDKHECGILDAALRAYLAELRTIKAICKHPVIVEGDPIDERIAIAMRIKKEVHARVTRKEGETNNDNQ